VMDVANGVIAACWRHDGAQTGACGAACWLSSRNQRVDGASRSAAPQCARAVLFTSSRCGASTQNLGPHGALAFRRRGRKRRRRIAAAKAYLAAAWPSLRAPYAAATLSRRAAARSQPGQAIERASLRWRK